MPSFDCGNSRFFSTFNNRSTPSLSYSKRQCVAAEASAQAELLPFDGCIITFSREPEYNLKPIRLTKRCITIPLMEIQSDNRGCRHSPYGPALHASASLGGTGRRSPRYRCWRFSFFSRFIKARAVAVVEPLLETLAVHRRGSSAPIGVGVPSQSVDLHEVH